MGNELILLSIVTAFLSALFWVVTKNKKQSILSLIVSFITLSSIALLFAYYANLFLTLQFQYAVVHQYANAAMPKALLFSAIWTGQSGSLLTWIFSLSFFILFVFRDLNYRHKVFPILFLFLGILLIMFWRSQPFLLNPYVATDGLGLNPVLSHPLLISHPPLAFIAYSAIVILYAYAIIAIRNTNFSALFNKIAIYTKIAFASMSFTILLGSFWAYEVTGWGGYWSFDPIENGSMVAWLLLVVLLHYLKACKRYDNFHRPIIVTCIWLMFSILHMVFLIRSGLISQLSAHAYLEGNLLWVLLIMDFAVLLLPLTWYFVFKKKLPSISSWKKNNKINLLQWANYLMLVIAGLVFVHTHLPFFEQSMLGNLIQSIYHRIPLVVFIVGMFLCLLLIYRFRNFLFTKGTMRYSPEKILVFILFSFLLLLLFQPTLQFSLLSSRAILASIMAFISLTTLYFLFCHWQRKGWSHLGTSLLHSALPLILLGSLLIALPAKTYWVHLMPQQSVFQSDLSATFTAFNSQETPAYIGSITSLPVQVDIKNYSYTAMPHIWKYLRTSEEEELLIPSISTILGSDHHLVPVGQGFFRIREGEIRQIGDTLFSFISYHREKLYEGIIREYFTLSFEHNQKVETFQLHRLSNEAGIQIRSDPFEIPLLNTTFQISTFQNQVLVVRSPMLKQNMEANYYIKPLAIILRWVYYLILAGSLWLLGAIFIIKKKGVRCKKKVKILLYLNESLN